MQSDSSDANAVREEIARVTTDEHERLDKFGTTLGVGAGLALVAFGVQLTLGYLTRVHWGLAALFSILILLVSIWLTRFARRSSQASTLAMGVVALLVPLLAAVIVAGWSSRTLNSLGIGKYVTASAPSPDVFTRLYSYTLADLIPALKITETLNLKPPIKAENFAAGLPVLVFRVFVLWFLFDAFKNWRNSRKDAGKEKSSDIVLFALFLLAFIIVVAVAADRIAESQSSLTVNLEGIANTR